ncbi:MAG TPA: PEP-CTERM sorting domain-containing protein [Candidatus Acidoferrales bacterium]|nr:PEP-CTERM sorting domain-containing protein [Candidatus Acidoferrales bacterium]
MSVTFRFPLILSLAALAAIPGLAGSITITVYPSVAPNAYGSPSYPAYVNNAIYALENGLTSYGTPGTPSYYQQTSNIAVDQMIVTGFPSWMGQADPGTVFGAAYANELGSRPLFGIDIKGGGTQFSISQLSFSAVSDDPGGLLTFGFAAGSYNYSADYVGIIYGPSGPTYITSGPNTQLVDEVVGRGSGNADAAYCSGCTIAQQQAAIDARYADFAGMSSFAGTYTLASGDGSILATGSGEFTVAPEPGTLLLFGAGLAGVGALARRRAAA